MKKITHTLIQKAFFLGCAVLFITVVSCNSKAKNESGKSDIDIHAVVIGNNLEAVNAYIAAGADLNVKDPIGGSSPLITASLFGHTEIAEALVEAGADLNHTNNDGSTALHTAAFFCRKDIVALLMAKGADQTKRNNFGSTALESVSGPYDQVRGVYEFMDKQFAPLGLRLDFDYIEENRPAIAAMLK